MTVNDVISLMKEHLDCDDIEPDDNFFDLGGNSIIALLLIENIKKESGVEIPLIDFIYAPTAQAIAHRCETRDT